MFRFGGVMVVLVGCLCWGGGLILAVYFWFGFGIGGFGFRWWVAGLLEFGWF